MNTSQTADLIGKLSAVIAATFGPNALAQDAGLLAQIAEDVSLDAENATLADIVRAVVNGQYDSQAIQLVGLILSDDDVAKAVVDENAAHPELAQMTPPQAAFDALSGGKGETFKDDYGAYGQLRHAKGEVLRLLDGIEAASRAVWVRVHRATYAFLQLQYGDDYVAQIVNADLTPDS